MNQTEVNLTERLIETGRLTADELKQCLQRRQGGDGLIDTLLRQDVLSTRELERVLGELPRTETRAGDTDPLLPSIRKLQRYLVLNRLGRGGIGSVYLAYDTKLKRSVALKVMRVCGDDDLPRYRREVEIASSLRHPHIAAVYDTESVDDVFVIAMQYVDGQALDVQRLTTREALEAVAHAARALEVAHAQGVIHRDIKPGNLMRTEDGHLFLMDFGTARPVAEKAGLTQEGTILGTPAYMSPEQAQGRPLDARTDVYSLGATLYALVTHQAPFEGTVVLEVLRKVSTEQPPRPRLVKPMLHRDIETIILKAMDPERERRYASARALAQDIERFLAGEPIEARPQSIAGRAFHYLRRRPWAMATVTSVMLGVVVAAGLLTAQSRRESRLAVARGLTEQAAAKIDRYDQQLFLPPEDLTPYRRLLDESLELCASAERTAGEPLASAHCQRARALVRRGDAAAADAEICRAVELEPVEPHYVERIRIRLRGLELDLMDVTRLMNQAAEQGLIYPRLEMPPRFDEAFRKRLEEDCHRVLAAGHEGTKEFAFLTAAEMAFAGRIDEAEKTARAAIKALPQGERAELHKVLALIAYMRFVEESEAVPGEGTDLCRAGHLDVAIEHVSQAIVIRRSDADLLRMRALMHVARGVVPLRAVQHALPRGAGAADEKALKEDWKRISRILRPQIPTIEALVAKAHTNAKADLDTAGRIRPDDPLVHLLQPLVYALTIRVSLLIAVADEWAGSPTGLQALAGLAHSAMLYRHLNDQYLLPSKAACEKALSLAPELEVAWGALARLHGVHMTYAAAMRPEKRRALADDALRVCVKALSFRPEPRSEVQLRAIKAKAHTLLRQDADAREEIRLIEALDPQRAQALSSERKP